MSVRLSTRTSTFPFLALVLVFVLASASFARAQTPTPPATQAQSGPDPDLQLVPAEPDFTITALPTTLRMPAGKLSFRLTHRFTRPIASGSVGDFFADFFGFDSAAVVGLELRYGIWKGAQVTVHRTNDRSIQFLGQYELLGQNDTRHFSIDALVATEGLDNFSQDFNGSVGAIVSHRFNDYGTVYVEPMFVSHTNVNPPTPPVTTDDTTTMIGLGARFRLSKNSKTYFTVEGAPRVAGYDVGVDHVSFGIEKRAGGHMFQFNISNSFATTLRQIARGGVNSSDWYVGFNLTRRFY